MAVSWDEARRCPSDGSPGKIIEQRALSRESGAPVGSKLVVLNCENTRCEYYDTPYLVQINPDGTIPEPIKPEEREKSFPAMGNFTSQQRARDVVAQLEAEQRRMTKPGAEVVNPYR